MISAPRQRSCAVKSCGEKFSPGNSLQRGCSPQCCRQLRDEKVEKQVAKGMRLLERQRREQERERKRQHRADKERVKPRAKLREEAIQAFNAYIRLRDDGLPCITCERPAWMVEQDPPLTGGVWHAGHFQSTGSAPEKRFDEDNVHRQCASCNRPGGHSRETYEASLRARIGDERVDATLAPREAARYTVDDFRRIRDTYRRRTRELKADRRDQHGGA